MKKQQSVCLAATLGCVLSMPALAAQPADADPFKEELKAVLNQHDEAINTQDIKALMAFYADDPGVVLMGTGSGEFWKGKPAIEEFYKQFFQDFKAGTLKHECPEASSGREGDVAWLVASCNMQDAAPDGQAREYLLNVSGVLKKEKAGWKFQTLHFSNLTGGDMPPSEEAPSPEDAPPAAETAPKAQ